MSMSNEEKLTQAVAYLRERNIYILDANNDFKPTTAVQTNVLNTIRRVQSLFKEKRS